MDFNTQRAAYHDQVEAALSRAFADWSAPAATPEKRVEDASAYALLGGGKRLRAMLALAAGEAVGLPPQTAEKIAVAVETLHAYSLVHDDLPAMDDDDLRRGHPTLHCAFDEATAILTGDGLQAAAFEHLADIESLSNKQRIDLIKVVSRAVGFNGMVGGQALDLAAEHQSLEADGLQMIHRLKTGALIAASAEAGAICAGASTAEREALVQFATAIGLAFQVTDDVLDVTGDSASLGKTAGKDVKAEKSTYVSALGLAGAQQEADRLLDTGLRALDIFGDRADPPRALAYKMVHRDT